MTHSILWKGKPTELEGVELKKGDKAPANFSLVANDMTTAKGEDFSGRARILATAPSLDTPVCDTETRRFNQEAVEIPGVIVAVITRDLPFAQRRWCGAAGIERLRTYSDYKERSFGSSYGVAAPANGLLARAVFVIDQNDVIQHVEYVKEIAQEPDYEAAITAAKALGGTQGAAS